jgi:hypothetical protein
MIASANVFSGACAALAVLIAAFAADAKTVNQAIDENLGDSARYQPVILAAQKAVAAHQPTAVAALVRYPIGVSIHGRKKIIKTPAEFVANYDAIFTPEIVHAVTTQKYEDLMVNYQGVMFGSGQMWINGICRDNACKRFDVKIVTIQAGPK